MLWMMILQSWVPRFAFSLRFCQRHLVLLNWLACFWFVPPSTMGRLSTDCLLRKWRYQFKSSHGADEQNTKTRPMGTSLKKVGLSLISRASVQTPADLLTLITAIKTKVERSIVLLTVETVWWPSMSMYSHLFSPWPNVLLLLCYNTTRELVKWRF